MSLRGYLLDRLALLLGFGGALVFLLLVVHLGVAPLRLSDALYIVLLGAVTSAGLLLVDYRRQLRFRREVGRRLLAPAAGAGLNAAPLPPAKTREQRAYAELLARSQREALGALQEHARRAEEHRTYVDLWVHQMKTPLTVLELTAQQQEPTDAWRSVAEEAEQLAHGLEQMLTTARLGRFELDLRPASVDLAELARAAVNDLKRTWIRHGVYPSVEAPPAPVLVETDAKWTQLVVRQLLTNAIKYSAAGQRVRLVVAPLPGGALLSIVDEGVGIVPEDVPRVFERYFTGANGRRAQASTGMGLYLAAEVCRRLGHELRVESAVGEGSTFSLRLAASALHRFEE